MADQISKYLTALYLPLTSTHTYPYGGIPVFSDFLGIQFSLNHAVNKGAAWGVFADYASALLIARLFLIAILVFYFWKQPSVKIPLILIIAGALGNIVDAFTYGHVVDMFHFVFWGYDYPIFNIADSAICLGIGLYFLQSPLDPKKIADTG
jgi:signal peptidase II